MKKTKTRHVITDYIMILCGVLSAAYGLKGFLLPNGFIDGGVTGISLLINQLSGFPLSWLIFLINIPFIILGYRQQSSNFAFKTFVGITCLAISVHFIEIPAATKD